VTLTGAVSSPEVAERAAALVASLAKTVVNHLRVRPPAVDKQILLRVKFAELDRDATSQFGASIVSTGATNTIGRVTTGQFAAATPDAVEARGTSFRITDALNVFAFRPDLDLAAFLRLLESQALLQVLAEPNLVTSDGKEASFLVGGEFPVPVLQGGAMAGAVTVQFREFGIRLHFTPQITPNGTIRMFVRPEVSTIDLMNAISIGGFTIPALATRRMETHIELAERQSFVIAGLIDDRVRATFNQIPGLASIPILGELFKSREKKRSKSELLVMVTPEIVRPLEEGEPKPEIEMPIEFLERFKRGQRLGYDGRLKAQ
jgi:pilus assembly protein CpaC